HGIRQGAYPFEVRRTERGLAVRPQDVGQFLGIAATDSSGIAVSPSIAIDSMASEAHARRVVRTSAVPMLAPVTNTSARYSTATPQHPQPLAPRTLATDVMRQEIEMRRARLTLAELEDRERQVAEQRARDQEFRELEITQKRMELEESIRRRQIETAKERRQRWEQRWLDHARARCHGVLTSAASVIGRVPIPEGDLQAVVREQLRIAGLDPESPDEMVEVAVQQWGEAVAIIAGLEAGLDLHRRRRLRASGLLSSSAAAR
ncbi:MAG: hypothetical protein V2A73_08590, partial [Pseudomonadota bacterium]